MSEYQSKNAHISDLCDHCAWPDKSLRFYAYMPMGIILLLLRSIAVATIYLTSFITPDHLKKILYQIQLKILGIQINCNLSLEEIKIHSDGCIVAANHISMFDVPISSGLPNATIMIGKPLNNLDLLNRLIITSAIKLSKVKQWHVLNRRGLARNIQDWRRNPSGTTLYTTPEMTIGNQRGIFRFNSAFLCFDLPVAPLAVRAENSMGVNLHPINSSSKAITLRLLMLPKIIFHLSFLEKKYRLEDESKDEFAKRVQDSIAEKLGVPATEWTAADKHEYRKQLNARKNQS